MLELETPILDHARLAEVRCCIGWRLPVRERRVLIIRGWRVVGEACVERLHGCEVVRSVESRSCAAPAYECRPEIGVLEWRRIDSVPAAKDYVGLPGIREPDAWSEVFIVSLRPGSIVAKDQGAGRAGGARIGGRQIQYCIRAVRFAPCRIHGVAQTQVQDEIWKNLEIVLYICRVVVRCESRLKRRNGEFFVIGKA